jgi:transcriptional regulator with XRE-family HTH domain
MRENHVANNIRAELARRRISQSVPAELLGLTHSSISRRLRGEVPFRDSELAIIANFLDVEVSALFTDLGAA